MSATTQLASTVYVIPLVASPQRFSIVIVGVTYNMALNYRDDDQAGWTLDIYDVNNNPLVTGIPLITGADLLEQYKYLGIGASLVVVTNGSTPSAVPTFSNLGTASNLYLVTIP